MALTIRNAVLSPDPAWGTRKDGSHVLKNQFLLIVSADRDDCDVLYRIDTRLSVFGAQLDERTGR